MFLECDETIANGKLLGESSSMIWRLLMILNFDNILVILRIQTFLLIRKLSVFDNAKKNGNGYSSFKFASNYILREVNVQFRKLNHIPQRARLNANHVREFELFKDSLCLAIAGIHEIGSFLIHRNTVFEWTAPRRTRNAEFVWSYW